MLPLTLQRMLQNVLSWRPPTAATGLTTTMATLGSQREEGQGSGSGSAALRFESLVNRSIAAWATINFVTDDHSAALEYHRSRIRRLGSIEDVLQCRSYWFFQLRSSFLDQDRLLKFDLSQLDRYILLPIDYGWVNNQDCYFISHYWRSPSHPDPDGTDLRMFQEDLVADTLWSYVWVDWTCMPQVGVNGKRTPLEKYYFGMMLQCIPMLVRDCAFEWRFPAWEPRAWILYEMAEYVLGHLQHVITEDNKPFLLHVQEMVLFDVHPVLDKYKYQCTNASDMDLVTGRLELLVILAKIFPDDVASRQELLDSLSKPANGSVSNVVLGVEINKTEGTVRYQGQVYRFTPTFNFTSGIAGAFLDDEKREDGAERAPSRKERPDE
ncbi:hypothetical protein MSAN_01533800 [Mycena sanguinolenta]|uniref:Uncharacterized protein n=1 Tax=Mycena sanguinolenta TaxID=230812 RepID=A0A8H6Y767_9AGAR|nr:hypothetical protein MSAN_01533800 [Mycena sanguinolenta]